MDIRHFKNDEGEEAWYIHNPKKKPPTSLNVIINEFRLHREGGPAIIQTYSETWAINGNAHREDGPASYSTASDIENWEEWYRHGIKHRIGGPASISSDRWGWYENGLLHRYDGPAYHDPNHEKQAWSYIWSIRGKSIDKHAYTKWIDDTGIDLKNLTPEDISMIEMRWL